MPKPVQFKNVSLRVAFNKEIATNILLLRGEADEELSFYAGQYFSIRVAEKLNRSYSITSAPGQKYLDFVVDITPNGPGSQFIKQLKEGDVFNAMGPFGFFNLEQMNIADSDDPLILIATGTGIAPFYSMALDLAGKNSSRKVYLYFGLRYDTESYFFEELEALSSKYSNLKFIPVISKPSPEWNGEVGHCQDIVKKMPVLPDATVLICGRTETVMSISADLIDYGYPKEKVHYEKFG